MNASITAVGPLEKSKIKAKYSEMGGIIAPTKTAIIKTWDIFRPIKIPIDDGIIKKAKANTSPTNLVVKEIPVPTMM